MRRLKTKDDSVPTPSNDLPLSGEDSMQLSELMLLCTNLQKQVLDLEKTNDAQAKEIAALKKRVQKLERKKKLRPTGLQRLRKVSQSSRVESSEDKDSLGDHEDESKQGRSIEDIDKDADVSLVDDTQGGEKIQVCFDKDLARNLQAQLSWSELIEEERLARKQEEEANIALIESSDNTQAMMEVVKSKKETEESSKGTGDELESDKTKKVKSSEEKAKGSRKKIIVIVEYKLLKEGIMAHYQLIRADGSSKRYSSMIRMLQDIDREDLQTLWKLVKTKHGDIRPEDEHERVLWGDLKVMFEPNKRE
ncbi:hypothetical protein Tco_0856832 [Tanacetum coccineum]|uniref:Uncharacterized protein n=1 Tax=Tanacetum coccineum TaxID=301880 RepID=A0ABQ5B4X4_9ASTR